MDTMIDHGLFWEMNELPENFQDIEIEELQKKYGKPILVHLPGDTEPPLFVCTLLHGNEHSGLYALKKIIEKYTLPNGSLHLPRAMSFFLGNLTAAKENLRKCDGELDFNRVWGGIGEGALRHVADKVTAIMHGKGVWASIDVHNNTGQNPMYSCFSYTDSKTLGMAQHFDSLAMHFTTPKGTQAMAFGQFCPSITIECGLSMDPRGIQKAFQYIDDALNWEEVPSYDLKKPALDLFEVAVKVVVEPGVDFTVGIPEYHEKPDLVFCRDLDLMNFSWQSQGTALAEIENSSIPQFLCLYNNEGLDVTERFLMTEESFIKTRVDVYPAMFTLDEKVIRQDCLGYFLLPMDIGQLDGL
jgi:succinylglutamate desuccinylase